MRCFVGFFGLTRSLRHTAEAIRSGIFEPLSEAGITTIRVGHFNLPAVISNPRSAESAIVPDRAESAMLELDLCWVEPQNNRAIAAELNILRGFPDIYQDDYLSLINLCHQLRSLARVWAMFELFGVTDDDLVILLRPDLLYLDRLIPGKHLAPLLQGRADLIVPGWQSWGGLNDRFAFCTGRAAGIYANRIGMISEACRTLGGMQGEGFLRYVAATHRLRVALTDMRGLRVRANGLIPDNDRAMIPRPAPPSSAMSAKPHGLSVRREMIDGFPRVSALHGTHYLDFLEALHRRRRVQRYLEIGTQNGLSLKCAKGSAVAIDPDFLLDREVWAAKPGMHLFEMTSDAFFAATDPSEVLGGPIELAFIDGMHLAEFVLRDFMNVEQYCAKHAVVVLHDALPLNFEMCERDRRPAARADKSLAAAWTGDVWRVVPLLRRARPDLKIQVLDCPPTGLVLISGLNPVSQISPSDIDRMISALNAQDASESAFWSFIESEPLVDSRKMMAEMAAAFEPAGA